MLRQLTLAAPLLALLAPDLCADRLITEDGRIIELVKARQTDEGYTLTFKAGELTVGPDSGIASIQIEGDMSDYEPQNDDEREKLEQGYVRYEGKWLSKVAYENLLRKQYEASKKRLEELAAHSDWHNGWQQETKHFQIQSNTSEELLDYYARLLEAYYDLMNKRIGIKPTLSYKRKKMTVRIFKSHKEFLDLSDADSPSVLGYFWSGDDSLNFFHDYEEPGRSEWVALHECTHLLTFLVDQQYSPQIWLNEAVADYYGSSEITTDKRGKISITPGLLQTDRVLTVQQAFEDDNYTRLEKLFFIDRGAFTGFHYAHGWSLVYFFYNHDNGKLAKPFGKFFKELYTLKKGIPYESQPGPGPTGVAKVVSPADIRDLLLKAVKYDSVEELEADWKEFIAAIPIDSGPALAKRGMNRVRRGEFKGALEDLDKAIAEGVEDPRVWAFRGLAKSFTGGIKSGLEDLQKAVSLDPLNAQFHFRLSQLYAGVAAPAGFDLKIKGEYDDPDGRRHAGFAAELDPENELYRDWYEQFQ